MGEILVSQELVQVEWANRLPSVLVAQEFVQVEWATRLPSVLVAQELVQVEYIPMDHGTKNMGAIIMGLSDSIPQYAYIESKREFEYFDAQVDFTLSSGVESSWAGIDIAFEIDSDNRFYIRSGKYLQQQSFLCDFRENGLSHYHTVSGTNDYGKLRISRYSGMLKVYYKDGDVSDWTEWVEYTGFPDDKGNILLGFYSAGDETPGGSLDNFRINNESGCSTCYFFDNFYGNDGDLYNQDLWTGSTSDIEIKDNKLHITYGDTYRSINTKYVPSGDFNAQVDFSIGSYQTSCCWSVALVVYFENGDRFDVRYYYTTSNPNRRYITTTYNYSADIWTTHVYYGSDIMSGKFRITRKGNIFSSYFLLGNKWFLLFVWEMTADTEISFIKLECSSWDTGVPSVECYFDNFVINDDFDFYNDIRVDGTYTHVDGNYIKLEGGNVHTNKVLNSANNLTIETSITFYDNGTSYGPGLFISNKPYLVDVWESGYKNISIFDRDGGTVTVNFDGSQYTYYNSGGVSGGYRNFLFHPEYGKPYVLGVKFIPGTGTVIYWQGPSSGHFVIDYIMNGNIYAWAGTMYGRGDYGDYVSRIHMFRCFEENIQHNELIESWPQAVGYNDEFIGSDGRSPNHSRWNVTGSPKIYNNSLKIIKGDKIQSKTFFCAPFEIIFDYNNLTFDSVAGEGLSLNIEFYDIYRDKIIGTSKFKVGYNGGSGFWVNYYCSGSSGNSSVSHALIVNDRKLKIVNDGYKIEYFFSSGSDNWTLLWSQNCTRQYYYRLSTEGIGDNTVFYINSISFDSEEFLEPTDAICLVPTAWKFSPTYKAYQNITYVPLNELIANCRHFSVDCVAKIDSSLFLTYFEADKDIVMFDGAVVVGDNYLTLTSAIDAAEDGQVIYVLPGSYQVGGYTITKKVLIVGVGDYSTINIIISGSSTILNGCDVTFKNLTILEQLPYDNITFRTQGSNTSYFTMDNCKYTSSNSTIELFKMEGSRDFYVYLRKSYIKHDGFFAYPGSGYPNIYLDILNCRISKTSGNMFHSTTKYKIRSMIYANSSLYEPVVTNSIPVLTLFSPRNETNIYLNTPKGMEKKITCNVDVFNYLSFGNCPGGVVFYGAKNDYYFSDYLMPSIDESYKLFIQGYIDTIRVFDNYQTYTETLNNINTVGDLGLNLRLAHNGNVVEYKIYEPLNLYNSGLYLGKGTSSIIDEFIWSKAKTTQNTMLEYYNSYLGKLGYASCNIYIDNAKYKFFIDFGSTIGIGSLIQSSPHNFTNTTYYSDDISDPSLLSNTCFLSEARWYSLYNNISYNASALTPGKFSVFPAITGCDKSRWKYTGEQGYIDLLPDSVLSVSSSLTDVYNIKWERNKTDINDYLISSFSDSVTISLKLFGGGTCSRIIIKSGYNIGTEFAGYITKCYILIDGTQRFSIDNNINSVITADFEAVSFDTIAIVIEEVKQVSYFSFNDTMLVGNVVFVNYVKVLSSATSSMFNDTLCNVYEFMSPIELESIETIKTGTCSLDYYHSGQYADGCITTSILDLDNPPNSDIVSILAKSDNLYSCGFTIDEYTVDILPESMTGSIGSWKTYVGDVELYEEFFYIQGTSTSIGLRFFKETIFEVGTYYESFGTYEEWAVTDELVLGIYSTENISNFYLCIGDKTDGRYYRWDFSLSAGWNNLRFNFYDSQVTKFVSNVSTKYLLFSDLAIYNVWCGGHQYSDGFMVLDNIFVDKSSVTHVLSSHKDSFYIPVSFESESGSVHMDYKSYWNSDGVIFGDTLSDKVLLSVFGDQLSFSLVNKISGKFVLGVHSYKYSARTAKSFGFAQGFNVNDIIKLRLEWSCLGGRFSSDLFINGNRVGRVVFSLVETETMKVNGVMLGGGSVYITSIYNSLSLCGQLKNIKVYSSNAESKVINDNLFVNHGGWKNLVDNSPLYVGEIQPSDYVELPVRYEGKSKKLNELNLKIKWVGIY